MAAERGDAAFVAFEHVQKSYDGETLVVKDLNLNIGQGEFLTMLGPSGSGKTTCLMMLAGFETATHGEIRLDGRPINNIPPHKRGIGMVFQNYALFPHMTVGENLAFPLEVRKMSKADIAAKVGRALDMVQMGHFAGRRPGQLSGGQQQRIALARALVFEPELVLMDEPLGALDKQLREHMQYEIKHLHEQLGVTVVYVTHDQSEALALSDEIVVFNFGKIIQRGTPQEIYRQPKSQFVADFIGSANFLKGKVKDVQAAEHVATVETHHGLFRCIFGQTVSAGQDVLVSARPEDLTLYDRPPGDGFNAMTGKIVHRVFLGEVVDYLVDAGDGEIRIRSKPEAEFQIGQTVHIGVSPQKCVALPS
jgi:putative spermidine/putrescine transport system ATP-binding protein